MKHPFEEKVKDKESAPDLLARFPAVMVIAASGRGAGFSGIRRQ